MSILRLKPAMASHRGLRRRTNEDAVGAEYPNTQSVLSQYGALFMVADGVGGMSDGDQASQLAISQMTRHYYGGSSTEETSRLLLRAAEATNRAILQKLHQQAATTLVAVVIQEEQLTAISVGDSLLFHIHNGKIEQLNELDVLQDGSADDGALTKVIGYREIVETEVIQRTVQPGDVVLLCTDGLTRYLDSAHLTRLASLTDPRDAVRRMVTEANRMGGADNIAVVLVQVGEPIAPEDIQRHVSRLMMSVSIQDAEPMMRPDVATKPNTQLPYGLPEITTDPPPTTPNPIPRATAPKPPAAQAADRTPLIVLAIVILVLGAAILGGGIALSSGGETPEPTQTPAPVTPRSEGAAGLVVGDVIVLQESVLTLARVNTDVGAFVALEGSSYRIEEQFTDNEGQLWIRLQQEDSEESGWVAMDDLPPYQWLGDG